MEKKDKRRTRLFIIIGILILLALLLGLCFCHDNTPKLSNDQSLISQFNIALRNAESSPTNVEEAKTLFEQNSLNDGTYLTESEDEHFYWCEETQLTYLVKDSNGEFTVIYPTDEDVSKVNKNNSYRLDKEYWTITCNIENVKCISALDKETSYPYELSLNGVGNVSAVKVNEENYKVISEKITFVDPLTSNITITSSDYVYVTGVELIESESVDYKSSKTLTYSVLPSNATNKNVTFTSSDTNVATVDNNGNVTAVNAGTTTITVTTEDGEYKDTCTLTVNKINPTVTAPTIKENLVYNNNDQVLVNAGSTTGGTLEYSLDDVTYSTELPVGKDAKTYTVYYRVTGDNNYNDVAKSSVEVTISKATAEATAPTAKTGLVYNNNEQELVNKGTSSVGKWFYKVNDGEYSENIPTAKTSGSYKVYFKFLGDVNHKDIAESSVDVTIAKATQTAPSAPSKDNATVTSTTVTLTAITTSGQGDIMYGCSTENDANKVTNWRTSVEFTGLNAETTYYFFAKYAGNTNYNEAISEGTAIKVIKSFTITNKLWLSTADTTNATTIDENGTVTLKYTTDSGYPDCFGVKNATLESYDKTTGTLVISNPTDDVVIMDANYLSFTANQDNSSVTIRFEQGSYEYSINNGKTWTDGENSEYGYGGTTIELKKAGDTVLVKGTNCSVCNIDMVGGTFWSFAMTGSISAGGSLTSVIDGLGIDKEVTLSAGCYEAIFEGCKSLTTPPELPATTLADHCYYRMFSGCTALTSAPELPAKTLFDYCYCGMFQECTSLTTAPELPATTLADSCYQSMFYGCTALTNVPEELSVTDLCVDCYYRMFENCTSLTTAPKLPATNLCDDCYYQMFKNCTSLTTAPMLPATNLKYGCYGYMFAGCTSLTTAPELSATNISDHGYWSMFDGCTTLKITTVKPTIGTEGTDWGVIISGAKTVEGTLSTTDMFNGCICAPGIDATPTFGEGTTYYWYK